MEFTARQIGELLKGQVEGNEHVKVNKLSKIEEGEPARFRTSRTRAAAFSFHGVVLGGS